MSIVRKIFVALLGGSIVVVGLVLIPTPAPEGWLIVFAGIALLSTEFSFAKRLMERARLIRQQLNRWMKRQPQFLQTSLNILGIVMLIALVAAGVWLILRTFL